MALPIPVRYLSAVSKLVHLPDSLFDELLQRIGSAPILSDPEGMTAYVGEIPDVSHEDLGKIIDLIYALYRVREFSEISHTSFLNELVKGVQEKVEPRIDEGQLPTVRARLGKVLSVESLVSLGKAINLQRAGERIYCDSRIISDIRPVFGKDIEVEPVGAVVIHTLKVGYHEGDKHKEFFIILDDEDLVSLREDVDRAISKSNALGRLLIRADVPKLGI